MYSIAQEKGKNYCNYFNYILKIIGDGSNIAAQYSYVPLGKIAEQIRIVLKKGNNVYTLGDFEQIEREYTSGSDATNLIVKLSDEKLGEILITYCVQRDGIRILTDTGNSGFIAEITGEVTFGNENSISAVCMDRIGNDLRSAYGPATSKIDDTIFCRESDDALRFSSDSCLRIKYDFDKKRYCFTAQKELRIWVEEQVFASRFYVKYKPINKKNTFPTPPAGWMTWYSVMFDACEQAVLENVALQKELFSDYGANVVWVDWEWCHTKLNDENPSPEIDFFHPNAERYPHGLKYVADKIKEQGFIPALWVGPTVENVITDFVKEHDNSLCANSQYWCSKYFYDLTSEAYLKEYIPMAFAKVKKDGYEAVKWDCLPATLEVADEFHSHLSNSEISSEQALRNVVQAGRDVLGENYYMMSCSGGWDREVLCTADIFDGARIGEDIFTWDDFIKNFLERIMRFYSLHNNMLYCDPDNLVVRPEHNNYEQAVSRTSLFALLGLPLTLGDDLRELPEERIEIIRRALPPMDMRPMDIREAKLNDTKVIVNLQISKSFEEWNVACITNLLQKDVDLTIDLDKDLHLDEGEYHVYDYWNQNYLGIMSQAITLRLPAYGSAVYSIRKHTGKKQIISTSRHISQGAFDLVEVKMDVNGNLLGRSKVVRNEPYVITYFDPDKKQAQKKIVYPEKTGEIEWVV